MNELTFKDPSLHRLIEAMTAVASDREPVFLLGKALGQSRITALPCYYIPDSTLRFSRVPEKPEDQMHMNMRHGLARSRADIHADVKAVWPVLCSQPRSHSEEHIMNRCQLRGRQLKEV